VTPTNIEVVRANSEAFGRKDADAMLELFAPEATVTDRRAIGWGEYQGADAIHSYYQGLFDNVAALREDLEVVSEEGDVVIAECQAFAHLAGQPEAGEMSFRYALRIELSGGLITSLDIYEDTAAAAAAGA
jgi:ketosteroid isomerase-like protein